jgi:hypothetical protein
MMAQPLRWVPARFAALGDTPSQRRLAALLAGGFLLGLASSFVIPFLSLWGTRAIGMTPFAFGMFMTSTSLSAMVLSTLMARWSDTRAPRRTVLMLAGAGGVLGYLGYACCSGSPPQTFRSCSRTLARSWRSPNTATWIPLSY